MTATEPRYTLSLDLNVLNHLGLNLYSNAAAALSEAVANAWDADATRVDITLEADEIAICDNGVGMTQDDINGKFLNVGYERRKDVGELTSMRRVVMGRKGIGKLSLFSIADVITVFTRREGGSPEGFTMRVPDIQDAIKQRRSYYPKPVASPNDLTVGTVLRLTTVKSRNLVNTRSALRRRLARRFAIIGTPEFTVAIDSEAVTYLDRDDLKAVQFLWQLGEPLNQNPQYSEVDFSNEQQFPHFFQAPNPAAPSVVNPDLVDGTLPAAAPANVDVAPPASGANLTSEPPPADEPRTIRGWIGTAKSVHDLKSLEDSRINSLNSIVVIARGRLIQEDILPAISEARIVRQYLTGQIEADFLDLTQKADIATSDRQRIKEDDERYQALLFFVNKVVKEIAGKWTAYRGEVGAAKVIEQHPILAEWLASLIDDGHRKLAREMIARIMAMHLDEENDRATFLRQAIFAFERMQVRGQLQAFVDSLGDPARAILAFESLDYLEAALYAEIVRTRLGVIDALQQLVDDGARERAFQLHLYKHLWLLDPSWERATDSPAMEKTFQTMLKDLEDREKFAWGNNRVDIQFVITAGYYVIIELKKADRPMKTIDLIDQGERYRATLAQVLVRNVTSPTGVAPRNAEDYLKLIEIVFVLGDWPENPDGRRDMVRTGQLLENIPGRVVTYDQLVGNARKAYDDYLRVHSRVNRIAQITDALLSSGADDQISDR